MNPYTLDWQARALITSAPSASMNPYTLDWHARALTTSAPTLNNIMHLIN